MRDTGRSAASTSSCPSCSPCRSSASRDRETRLKTPLHWRGRGSRRSYISTEPLPQPKKPSKPLSRLRERGCGEGSIAA
ncbi:hypothetical protein LC55x_5006 [Lysobacter capsici]|nr:hypothetical protein LC55x_5006 [Lysobacter capsici]